MNVWVVKCRWNRADGSKGWHWDSYFDPKDDWFKHADKWGGADWIRSPASKKFIREDVKKGDVVLCYQQDESAIVGITRMAEAGEEEDPGSGQFNLLWLGPGKEAAPIDPPVTIRELREEGCDPKCFQPGTQGTVFPVEQAEFGKFLQVLTRLRPGIALPSWLGSEKRAPAFILNSNDRYMPEVHWLEMVDKEVGCTGGDIKFGRLLRKLEPRNRLFLYVNKIGVVAEGTVTSEWSGRANRPSIVWKGEVEYSVGVNWTKGGDEQQAVSFAELRQMGLRHHMLTTLTSVPADVADKISARLPGGPRPDEPTEAPIPPPGRGGGFGSPEQNREVECKAVQFVTKTFEGKGWEVRSVEADRCGYDLLCKRGSMELHIEVKGSSGDSLDFNITANEVQTATTDEQFRLCVVVNALTANRSCREMTGAEFLDQYELAPLQYRASFVS